MGDSRATFLARSRRLVSCDDRQTAAQRERNHPGLYTRFANDSRSRVKATRYFKEQVLRKRPYIDPAWCTQIVSEPIHRELQPDGRVRYWGEITRPGERTPRFLRVVTLEDGETIHSAFFNRRFRKDAP